MTTIERAECWIFKQVVQTRYPLWSIREDEAGFHANDYHGLENDELVRVLQRMFAHGDLMAYRNISYRDAPGKNEPFVPTPSEIEVGVLTSNWKPRIDFELTTQGGARWEAYFQPDWNCFLNPGHLYRGDGYYWDVEAATLSAIENYFLKCGIDIAAEPQAFMIENLVPWKATYWKTLPAGVRCSSASPIVSEKTNLPDADPWYTIPDEIGTFDLPPPVDWSSLR